VNSVNDCGIRRLDKYVVSATVIRHHPIDESHDLPRCVDSTVWSKELVKAVELAYRPRETRKLRKCVPKASGLVLCSYTYELILSQQDMQNKCTIQFPPTKVECGRRVVVYIGCERYCSFFIWKDKALWKRSISVRKKAGTI